MKTTAPLCIPIESFIVTHDENDPKRSRLIYFDPKGTRHEMAIRRTAIDAAISKLDGKPRAISRSSGGLVTAQPYQLVLHHCVSEGNDVPPELRIKVRFKEFVRDEEGRIATGTITTVTKNILPEEVLNEVSYDLRSNQKFLLDFGQGSIPVAIFGFVSDADGANQALFVEADAIERAIRTPAGRKIEVQRFRVAKDLVRVVGDLEKATEVLGRARANSERLKRLQGSAVPASLEAGDTITVPTGLSYQELCEFLRQSASRWNRQSREEVTLFEYELQDESCVTSDVLLFMEPV